MKKTDSQPAAKKAAETPVKEQPVKEAVTESTATKEADAPVELPKPSADEQPVKDAAAESAATKAPAPKKAKVPEGMQEYFKLYPDTDTFYRTADGQVFLGKDKQWAVDHQKHLGGELETIKRP